MRSKLMWPAALGAATVVTVLCQPANVLGTPASGFTGTTLALGRFGAIDVFNHMVLSNGQQSGDPNADEDADRDADRREERHRKALWLSWQKTRGASDVYVQNNVWQPGGSTGWHSHPGHSLIIVTAGAVTAYEGDDPDCKPTVYTKGMGFVDAGGTHVHLLRNEGTVPASTVAVQLIPAGAVRRVDAPDPGTCPF